jgi:hypothetical protein
MHLASAPRRGWEGSVLVLGQFLTHTLYWAARTTRAWSDVKNGIEPGFSDIELAVSTSFLAAALVVLYGLWRDRTWAFLACLAWSALALPISIDIALETAVVSEVRLMFAMRACGHAVLLLVLVYSGIRRVVQTRRLQRAGH